MPEPRPISGLETVRQLLITSGGGYLRNVRWEPGVTCSLCAGIWGSGYTECFDCPSWQQRVDLADRRGFVTYAIAGRQSGQVMYGYKEQPRPSEQNQRVVTLMHHYAVLRHWACLNGSTLGPLTHWTTVPSLRGRAVHPIREIAGTLLNRRGLIDAQLTAAPNAVITRSLRPANFTVPAALHDAHVLLVEDTWVGGGRVQSAAAALKLAGARAVTALTLARWLDPGRGHTAEFITTLRDEFDPDLCPFTGHPC